MKLSFRVLPIVIAAATGASLPASAEILFRYSQSPLFDGRYGPIAKAQERANAGLAACGKVISISVDGKFGPGTRIALSALALCSGFSDKLAADVEAKGGALTDTFWTALIGTAVPNVDERARTIMLTYEATDYTHLEWNFCQSRPLYYPSAGQPVCYSNDPRSYLTWGPNGATAGGGREVQLILGAVEAALPSLIDESFGTEAGAVWRMFHMRNDDDQRSLEVYLCGIWIDPARRSAWKAGFDAVGRAPFVRRTFDSLYQSASLDGGKIRTFFKAYETNGLIPTEVDYGFFKDRAAHTSPSQPAIEKAIADELMKSGRTARWKIRQAIALNVRPSGQREDRLGRDVAFYIDGSDVLGAEEQNAWAGRGRLRASDVGLSDTRAVPNYEAGAAFDTRVPNPATLTAAERAACPAAVLQTKRPPPR